MQSQPSRHQDLIAANPSDSNGELRLPKRCNLVLELQFSLEYASPVEMRRKRCFNEAAPHPNCFSTLLPENFMDDHDVRISKAFRKPRRVTITIPYATYLVLERRSYEQGRSLSNLSAYLLECAVNETFSPKFLQSLNPSRVSMDGHHSR